MKTTTPSSSATCGEELRAFLKSDVKDAQLESESLMPSYKSALSETEINRPGRVPELFAREPMRDSGPCISIRIFICRRTASAGGPVTYERLLKADEEPGNWLMYSGNYRSYRHSRLDQINARNVSKLHLKWVYQMKTTHHVETTPLVVDGIMYATRPPNDVVALDTQTGRQSLVLPLSRSRQVTSLLRTGEPRIGHSGRPAIHGHGRCQAHRARRQIRPPALENGAGRLSSRLCGDRGAADCQR